MDTWATFLSQMQNTVCAQGMVPEDMGGEGAGPRSKMTTQPCEQTRTEQL